MSIKIAICDDEINSLELLPESVKLSYFFTGTA